jgi:beta-N-acetylhexosaminidase
VSAEPIAAAPEALTLARRCLLVGFCGIHPPQWLTAALADGLGGVVLFGSNVGPDLPRVIEQLRADRDDVVIAIDEEGGEVSRLDAGRPSSTPGAAALGALDDPDVTQAVYHEIGQRLVVAGVNVDLAPVADVNVDPRNPVIGVRSFGAEPHLVARHVAAAVRGLQSAGVAACAKHFPGHGDTTVDSHEAVPTLTHARETLAEIDLPPFRAAIAAGVRAVMPGHLRVPALDRRELASLSPATITGLLRGELGFTGAVITDALEMRAVADTVGMTEAAVRALQAGADALCLGAREWPELLDAIPVAVDQAVRDGRLPVERLRDAAARTRSLARSGPSGGPGTVPVDPAAAAARSVSVHGELPRLRAPAVLEFRPDNSIAAGAQPAGVQSLAARLAGRLPGTTVLADAAALGALAADADLVLVVRDPVRHADQAEVLARLANRPGRTVIVDVGWPTADVPDRPTIRTRGTAGPLLDAAVRLLVGEPQWPES